MKKVLPELDFHGLLQVMIARTSVLDSLKTALSRSRVVVLAGPRQCGKTTLARQL
jgi:predicted AAA+ superfamily ATPase